MKRYLELAALVENAKTPADLRAVMDRFEPREARFVDEYLKDLNAKEAAIRAGYSERSAKQIGFEVLQRDHVAAAIAKRAHERARKVGVDADTVLSNLLEMADFDPADAYDDDGVLKKIREIPRALRRCIASIKTREVYEGAGDQRKLVGYVHEVKFNNEQLNANVWIGKHLRLFLEQIDTPNNSNLAQLLAEAFGRAKT